MIVRTSNRGCWLLYLVSPLLLSLFLIQRLEVNLNKTFISFNCTKINILLLNSRYIRMRFFSNSTGSFLDSHIYLVIRICYRFTKWRLFSWFRHEKMIYCKYVVHHEIRRNFSHVSFKFLTNTDFSKFLKSHKWNST